MLSTLFGVQSNFDWKFFKFSGFQSYKLKFAFTELNVKKLKTAKTNNFFIIFLLKFSKFY